MEPLCFVTKNDLLNAWIMCTVLRQYTRKKSSFRKGIKMNIFFLFTIIYLKIDKNVAETISLRQ